MTVMGVAGDMLYLTTREAFSVLASKACLAADKLSSATLSAKAQGANMQLAAATKAEQYTGARSEEELRECKR